MKNRILRKFFNTVALTSAIALGSCGVTDLSPEDSINDATFWKSTSDLEQYANSFYGNLGGAGAWYDNNTDVRADVNINTFFSGAHVVPENDDNWKFETIRKLNYFLNRYQQVTGDEVLINHYVAEVRFFRALEYWGKVKRYGDFPWYDKDLGTSDLDLIYKGRDPRAFVVGKIIEDLKFATENLRPKQNVETGRLYDMVAQALLARVSLYEGTRAKYANDATFTGEVSAEALLKIAQDASKHIIDSGDYSIQMDAAAYCPAFDEEHPLNYYAIFTQLSDISNASETILSRIYVQDIVTHNVTRQLAENNTGMTRAMFEQYLCLDGKPFGASPLYNGHNTLTEELVNRDRRLYQSIRNVNLPFEFIDGEVLVDAVPISGGAPTGYTFTKMRHSDPAQQIANSCFTQWYLYRYAETLLVYAEAKAELGTLTQADVDMTINVLRQRAGVSPLTIGAITADPNALDYGYTVSPELYEIRRERSVELMGEGFRYDDVMRWRAGKLLENPKAVYGMAVTDQVKADYPGVFDSGDGNGGLALVNYKGIDYIRLYSNLEGGYTWNDKMYLYPLPLGQLSLNSNLTQNPGW